ncbi:MAG: hypothetical protein ACI4UM_09660 [Succinivibrio sp.]
MDSRDLSAKEQLLIDRLQELDALCLDVCSQLEHTKDSLCRKDQEIQTLRREIGRLKEENNLQKELLQTLRNRVEAVLDNLE